ncbi:MULTISPECIES: cobaltochelatase subunit CobN [unclassified Thioalkalivibrio]|uniref:cobaltochelatase subunit CobN n=1 Tax=unclassified Thioalkalivibrio TaxID=2621013 RepID=UPI0003694EFC|nr:MULTISPECIES: cobaltochelatase subunit CobN [unclassified Thioalkalivibrio]
MRFRRTTLIAIAFFLFGVGTAGAGPLLVGVVSDRSAAEVAAGAHRFLEAHPEAEVVLRTPEQLTDKSDEAVAALWREADAVLVAAVFGDQAARLDRLLREAPPPEGAPILAINSVRHLTALSRIDGEAVLAGLDDEMRTELAANPDPGEDPRAHLSRQQERFPEQADWLTGRAFYQGRTPENMEGLMRWLAAHGGHAIDVPDPDPRETIRYYRHGSSSPDSDALDLEEGPAVALLDLDTGDRPGDRALLDAACEALENRDIQCFVVLARWGGASREAIETLEKVTGPADLAGIVSLQDFVVGGGGNREAVAEAFGELDVPVIKGIRLADVSAAQWRLSHEGIPWDKVHYHVAMPELQGMSQPMVLAAAGAPEQDERTGVRLILTEPVGERVEALADRVASWQRLRTLDNADKRVAVVYYNHPPGRQNIGADKLDVPESLLEMLQRLEAAGYDLGDNVPEDAEALLDMIQDRAVNLPEQADALDAIAGRVAALDREQYQAYFDALPESIRAELVDGPIGYLQARLEAAKAADEIDLAQAALESGVGDLRHMLESYPHAAQDRALDLLAQFEAAWEATLAGEDAHATTEQLRKALVRTGIPGLTGWGEPPGEAMTRDGEMLFPGIEFGNVFIGPQPPRGWEVSERLLHANTTFPPTHQYVGFYHWIRDHFEADALVYVGRHSTREFLPRRRAGLAPDDYPEILGGALPIIYPYIVDGVGEGIQAKRRAMGVMISHLTPPLAATELYDSLLELRQLVETYEAAAQPDAATRSRAAQTLRERIEDLGLTETIEHELARGHHHDHGHHHDEHGDHHDGHHDEPDSGHGEGHEDDHGDESRDADHHREHGDEAHEHAHEHNHENEHADEGHDDHGTTSLTEMDEELLVHEIGHYLTDMQEDQMPLGLHVFGRDWSDEAVDTMLESMAGDEAVGDDWAAKLRGSPASERAHLLAALEGRFVPPGQGNDPIRTPEVLPTGRNFHALAADLVPTRIAWGIGQELAADAREHGDPEADGSEAIILWASDTVRDEGVMIAFGLDMLGIRPAWNSRGIVQGLERMDLDEAERDRHRDALFTTSGLFRDLYEDQLVWLDRAVRLALDGSSEIILAEYPELEPALEAALAPLGPDLRDPGDEPLARNDVAAQWVEDTQALRGAGLNGVEAGQQAALRVFGTAPGAYGAGVNRLADRSGAWEDRAELGAAYIRRMGHAYGADESGGSAHEAFEARLGQVGRTYLGRASHLYGLLDNDDGFDFQGGLSTAVESIRGEVPDNRVLQHADPDDPRVETLGRALMRELQGQNLNPQWIEPLMDHGYAGARTMARDFVDNLWGWQVTNPEIIRSWVWDEVHDVYLQDRHGLGLDAFLADGHNVHVKTHLQAVHLVAASHGFWDADPEVLDALSERFAELVAEHGLPGSGHTRPDHPMLDEVAERLDDADLREAFDAVRAAAQIDRAEPEADPSRVTEIQPLEDPAAREMQEILEPAKTEGGQEPGDETAGMPWLPWLVAAALFLLLLGGIAAGRRR